MSNEEIEKYNLEQARIFGTNLKRYLAERRMLQSELAKALDVSESTVGKWTLMKSMPALGTVEYIARLWGINKSDLMEERTMEKMILGKIDSYNMLLQSLKENERVLLSTFGGLADEDKKRVIDLVERLRTKEK